MHLFASARLADTAQHKCVVCPSPGTQHGGMDLGFAATPLREKILSATRSGVSDRSPVNAIFTCVSTVALGLEIGCCVAALRPAVLPVGTGYDLDRDSLRARVRHQSCNPEDHPDVVDQDPPVCGPDKE